MKDAVEYIVYSYDPDQSVEGCSDESACNYDPEATLNDGSCEYPEDNFDCDGNCVVEFDCLGECGGDAVVDECGVCDGPGLNEDGCCGEDTTDCTGECGGDAALDCAGECNGSATEDCAGECNGSAVNCLHDMVHSSTITSDVYTKN